MPTTAKPFSWIVRLTVAPLWVADGFTLDDARAHLMLAGAVDCARGDELQAVVLEAPSPLHIANVQGYHGKHPGSGQIVRELIAGTPHTNSIRGALIAARNLLDSVAFVAKEGDTAPALEKIAAALQAIDTRQGEAVEVEG